MTSAFRAAWVPLNAARDGWTCQPDEAVQWIAAEARSKGTRDVLVTDLFHDEKDVLGAGRYRRGVSYFSRRSKNAPRGVPVVVDSPTLECFNFAIRLRPTSLCVVEGGGPPLAGWAAVAGALDLCTGSVTESQHPTFVESVRRLARVGHNGYGPDFDREMAAGLLKRMQEEGLPMDEVPAALAAAAHVFASPTNHISISADAQRRVMQLISRLS